MYLKSLTLKGFKSFADPTSLDLEPGVTVVVGPNGSGKSNVVDAIAWVLGAQGPRVVRSAKMDDVIFAGTDRRSPLGRAEVSLTIDNASRRLPIEFNEVTITRTLFRSGESEYALNGVPCRLLDVQELLSDSGVGRQQHVIVGQGQLDVVLAQRPEDRRAVIEEAAGVLKYRRRRERAERRLETSEAALQRLTDLLREVRRQIRPLERQAASAVRHEQLDAELRALRLHLAGVELTELEARRRANDEERRRREFRAGAAASELAQVEVALASASDRLEASRDEGLGLALARVDRLGERAAGLAALLLERQRAQDELVALLDGGASVATLEAELTRNVAELERLEGELETFAVAERELAQREAELRGAEAAHAERFADVTDEVPVELVSVRSAHNRLRSDHSGAGAEAARAFEQLAAIVRDQETNATQLHELTEQLERLEVEQDRVKQGLDAAREAEDVASEAEASCRTALEETRTRHQRLQARLEALEEARDAARAATGLAHLGDLPGIAGTVLDLLDPGDALLAALSAAIETMLDAVVVRNAADAPEAARRLRSLADGGAVVALDVHGAERLRGPAPHGLEWLVDAITVRERAARPFAERVLADVALCRGGFDAALAAASAHPELIIVTPEGDRFAPTAWRVGLRSRGASPAALEEVGRALDEIARALPPAGEALATAEADLAATRERRVIAEREWTRGQAELGHLRADLERSESLAAQLIEAHAVAAAAATLAGDRLIGISGELATLEGRLFALEELGQAQLEASTERLEHDRALEHQRATLREARRAHDVQLAGVSERRALVGERDLELREQIAQRAEDIRRAEDAVANGAAHSRLVAIAEHLEQVRHRLGALGVRVASARDHRVAATRAIVAELDGLRSERTRLETEIDEIRDARQRLEIDATEARVRREAALELLARELGATAEAALSAPVPDLPEGADARDRTAALEAELITLGPVNPLAREELSALEERSGFLETQLEDVREARRELHQIIRAVDEEIVEVFTAAFADVEAHFTALFELLFPGGSGRLVLTDPDDPLRTGVEIEARPAGRNVRRLSLLSGGERSLTALAFLFAVFRSRPSPFYVLDEVEAALDEVNLRRFLGLLEEFRNEAQLIVVSHQKKTMESADALYGVTMQPGGASRVVSERIARADLERELASP